nr:hypothetical protein FKNOFAIL_00002 [Klebsiella pneumoniae]UUW41913.1 hypothetical protein [Klebsiella michiganensis]UVN19483.1 hypothetical protein [Klebsiella michiganensis]
MQNFWVFPIRGVNKKMSPSFDSDIVHLRVSGFLKGFAQRLQFV